MIKGKNAVPAQAGERKSRNGNSKKRGLGVIGWVDHQFLRRSGPRKGYMDTFVYVQVRC
jgi:hypothetical protein